MEGSGFFEEEAGKGGKKEGQFIEAEGDTEEYKFPPEIEITRLQHEIDGINKQLQALKENDEKLDARAKTASDRLTGISLNGKEALIAIARTLNQAIEEEKLQLTAERKKLEKEKQTLQEELDKIFKDLPSDGKEPRQ